jgi:hypothetical protein
LAGTIGVVIGWFALVQFAAPSFSHDVATLSIAHGLAECAHATLFQWAKEYP